jgi:hypothetical protein
MEIVWIEWGARGREFESRHADHLPQKPATEKLRAFLFLGGMLRTVGGL